MPVAPKVDFFRAAFWDIKSSISALFLVVVFRASKDKKNNQKIQGASTAPLMNTIERFEMDEYKVGMQE